MLSWRYRPHTDSGGEVEIHLGVRWPRYNGSMLLIGVRVAREEPAHVLPDPCSFIPGVDLSSRSSLQASLADGKADNTIRRLKVFTQFYQMVRAPGPMLHA